MPRFQACGWGTLAKMATSCAVTSRAGDPIEILLQSLYIVSKLHQRQGTKETEGAVETVSCMLH